ncbi:MAG: HEAT repeat domain-containing protein [Dehalococcoidia bacterium]
MPDDDQPQDDLDDDTARPAVDPLDVIRSIAAGETLEHERLRALSTPSDEVVGRMLGLWPSLEPHRRRELLATLQHLATEDVTLDFHRLHLSALRDQDPATRILAVRGLWEQEREDYMRLLIEQLRNDTEASVREAAADVLGNYVLNMEFGLLGEEATDDLTSALRETVEDVNEAEEVRAAALSALGPSSEDWVAELIGAQYESGEPRMRVASLLAMGRNADEQWLPILLYNFDDEEPQVRAAAATATGQLLMEEGIDPLLELVDDSDEEVGVAAVMAIGEIAGEGAERILADLMGRQESHIRDAAREALIAAQLIGVDYVDNEDDT